MNFVFEMLKESLDDRRRRLVSSVSPRTFRFCRQMWKFSTFEPENPSHVEGFLFPAYSTVYMVGRMKGGAGFYHSPEPESLW